MDKTISLDDLKDYFEGGRKNERKIEKINYETRERNSKKFIIKKRSKTLSRKTLSMRARSDSSVNYRNYEKSIEKALLEKFADLFKR